MEIPTLDKLIERLSGAESLLDSLDDAISVQGTDFRVIHQNKAHIALLGDRKGEFCFSAFHALSANCPACPMLLSFKDGRSHLTIEPELSPDGIMFSEVKTSAVTDSAGRIVAGMEVIRDVTARKKDEERLRANKHMLKKIISGISHEIRNPLFGISSVGQILRNELKSTDLQELVDAMLGEVWKINALINKFNIFGTARKSHPLEIELGFFLDAIAEQFTSKDKPKSGVVIDVKVDEPIKIKADSDKLIMIFSNLIENSLDAKATNIKLSAGKEDKRIKIRVSDNGIGMSADVIEKAREPFYTTKRGRPGLGLPIAYKFVEEHGWTLNLSSKSGLGTTATITV